MTTRDRDRPARRRAGQVTVKTGPVVALLSVLLAVIVTAATPHVKAYLQGRKAETEVAQTSVAGEIKSTLRVAGDPWSGYFIFRSEKLRNHLLASKIGYAYATELDLARRFEGLAKGDYDLVVATIDGYTLNGLKSQYPGVITWVIDESYGGDAIVGGPKVQTLDDLDALPDLARIAYADGYPSEHLLNAMVTQFKKKVKPVPVVDSKAAYAELAAGKVDAAVLWEPETTNAQASIKGAKVLISTRDMVEFIVDVVVASRKVVAEKPELVEEALRAYFATLRYYQREPLKLAEAVAKDAEVPVDTAQKIVAGIRFVSLADNAFHWLGVGGADAVEKVSRIVTETIDIQKAQGRLATNPLSSPFAIINRTIVERAMRGEEGPLAKKFTIPVPSVRPSPVPSASFKAATATEWDTAEKIGTLEVAPIYFASGSTELAREDCDRIDDVAKKLSHYPALRLKVVGHTSPGGDAKAARQLSEERAAAVADYLVRSFGVARERILAIGRGGEAPLARKPNESSRSHAARCQRVEFVLVTL